ncbi:MAG: oligosaccharide flippase family protein, partial [Nocardioidaceae bacterium]|nr:oligosaccharide flippase family protein [Nocardioidaceae bacterium]
RVMFPALTRLRDDPKRLGQAWLRALSAATAFTAPIAVGMAVAAPALIEVMFGGRWLGHGSRAARTGGVTPDPHHDRRRPAPSHRRYHDALPAGPGDVFRHTDRNRHRSALGHGGRCALLVKFYLEVILSMPCVRQTKLTAGDLMRAMRGVWLSCLILAAAGLAVRHPLRPVAGLAGVARSAAGMWLRVSGCAAGLGLRCWSWTGSHCSSRGDT